MRYKAVFVSPHLDDAVFSCGGAISMLAVQGPVLVLNVFDRYRGEVKHRAIAVSEARHQEERDAGQCLGFTSLGMGELDAVFRRPAYRSPANLFRPPQATDLEELPRLRQALLERLASLEYEQLYIPLGIGWHVDHILTHLALREFGMKAGALFYEDAPYCLVRHATQYRLLQLGDTGNATPPGISRQSFATAWMETVQHYLGMAPIRRMRPLPVRWGASVVIAYYFWHLLRRNQQPRDMDSQCTLSPILVPLDRVCLQRKVDAIWKYRTQAPEFFLDTGDCENRYQAYADVVAPGNGALERYWKMEVAARP